MEPTFVIDPKNPHLGGNIRGGDPNTYCPPVWDYLINTFKPKSIVDVGCGEGHLMQYFHNNKILTSGIEGLEQNKENAAKSIRGNIFINDYSKNILKSIYASMVISCEFVEHIEDRYMQNFLPQFCACETLVFTHAAPEQAGYHHVNCQYEKYWIDLMEYFKFILLLDETKKARSLSGDTFWKSVLIFQK